MSDVVIRVENLYKHYRLGMIGTGTLSHDLNRWWYAIRGKENPYLKISEKNVRGVKGKSDYVWALEDINFDVKRGATLGIIGKNGAGKSTLLKILSRVTGPTKGGFKVKGRIASLLEVGTGFHQELTGRENIFTNGAILGMTKAEIKKKLDEIIAFSGIERYIDTPAKRYSSGMYVRLAFAVAAHLDSEILIADEVLAVGDAEFQKKCLGKMKDVAGSGRTVLFVSHNLVSLRALCTTSLLMQHGKLIASGETNQMISMYLAANKQIEGAAGADIPQSESSVFTGEAKFKKLYVLDENGEPKNTFFFNETIVIVLHLEVYQKLENVMSNIFVLNQFGERILMATANSGYKPCTYEKGEHEITIKFNDNLMPGEYSFGLSLANFFTGANIDFVESFGNFTVAKESKSGDTEYPWATVHGYIQPDTDWKEKKIN